MYQLFVCTWVSSVMISWNCWWNSWGSLKRRSQAVVKKTSISVSATWAPSAVLHLSMGWLAKRSTPFVHHLFACEMKECNSLIHFILYYTQTFSEIFHGPSFHYGVTIQWTLSRCSPSLHWRFSHRSTTHTLSMRSCRSWACCSSLFRSRTISLYCWHIICSSKHLGRMQSTA